MKIIKYKNDIKYILKYNFAIINWIHLFISTIFIPILFFIFTESNDLTFQMCSFSLFFFIMSMFIYFFIDKLKELEKEKKIFVEKHKIEEEEKKNWICTKYGLSVRMTPSIREKKESKIIKEDILKDEIIEKWIDDIIIFWNIKQPLWGKEKIIKSIKNTKIYLKESHILTLPDGKSKNRSYTNLSDNKIYVGIYPKPGVIVNEQNLIKTIFGPFRYEISRIILHSFKKNISQDIKKVQQFFKENRLGV